MKENFDIKVANGVATKKKYVSPEIEVVSLDEQPKLLSASYDASFQSIEEDDI